MNSRKRHASESLLPLHSVKQRRKTVLGSDGHNSSPSEQVGTLARWMELGREFIALTCETLGIAGGSGSDRTDDQSRRFYHSQQQLPLNITAPRNPRTVGKGSPSKGSPGKGKRQRLANTASPKECLVSPVVDAPRASSSQEVPARHQLQADEALKKSSSPVKKEGSPISMLSPKHQKHATVSASTPHPNGRSQSLHESQTQYHDAAGNPVDPTEVLIGANEEERIELSVEDTLVNSQQGSSTPKRKLWDDSKAIFTTFQNRDDFAFKSETPDPLASELDQLRLASPVKEGSWLSGYKPQNTCSLENEKANWHQEKPGFLKEDNTNRRPYINRKHIHNKQHKASVAARVLQLRRELFNNRKRQGFTSTFSDFESEK
ncbi:hypothetical protein BDQ12DRAFT_437372 [Crucibulum laeve]|uniref:Uncharacterized protein n=1 Tax=Crucibulum laeve TaxID=68775 RepID=A0A5C3M7Q1_9AGAR|nr:hypothetical protein BDQ12DRAFT_437372 [Crucibulum laeve]